MTGDLRALRASEQLNALCNAEDLPPRVRALGQRVQKQLDAPVRLALVGEQGTSKVALVNGFVRAAALPDHGDMPPMILRHGTDPSIDITTNSGDEVSVEDESLSQMDAADMALIQIKAPLPLLERISLLTVPIEGSIGEVHAALHWAASEADVVVWCTHEVTEKDQVHWQHLPPSLRDHAFLAVLSPPPTDAPDPSVARIFRSIHYLGIPAGTVVHEKRKIDRPALQNLRETLLAHVSQGRMEDLEGAMIFLDRYQPKRNEPDPADFPETDGETADQPAPSPPVAADASRVLDHLIARANALAELVPDDAPVSGALSEQFFDHCVETLEECLDQADPGFSLADGLGEASDLLLLMQLEATPTAMADAVALLLQVRTECAHPLRPAERTLEAVS